MKEVRGQTPEETKKITKAQTIEVREANNAESPKKCMESVLGDFDESYGLDELFQTGVDHYQDIFDDSMELEPMIGPEHENEMKDEPSKHAEPLSQTLDAWRHEVKQTTHLDTHSITEVDGGPQSRQDASRSQDLGMAHKLTSPDHAEQGVGATKKLLKKTGSRRRLGKALLEYRDTPRVGDELNPAQWLFGRCQRTRAPAPKHYQRIANAQLTTHMKKKLKNAEKVKENEPKLASPEFKLDDRVVVQHPKVWDTHGHITRKLNRGRYRRQANAGLIGPGKFIKLRAAHEPPTTTSWTPKPPWSPKPAPQARREGSKRTRKKPSRYLDRRQLSDDRAIGSRFMKFRSSPPDVATSSQTPKLGGM